ncbi:hypothetical protein PGH07_00865 [Sulfurovum sp. zt1-1]|uniref:Integral membrane protein n=1 Tax=Sulfurovum zhangzhouensis TaxID=3019067 RepID=A0ABT7QV57_9BACT|nr:hypothetical protein [Sulfurovum zhangzhouensis]MDM5270725.1 hypothetical protein [Sulfurovum zhangzhouensis]
MKTISLKIIKLLLIIDLFLIAGSIIFFDTKVLYNTQIGFFSSTLVMIGSMFSYLRMVNKRVEHNIITVDDSKDVIDKLEDPYDLYSEDIVEDPDVDLAEAIKEEKQRMKANKRSLFQTLKDTKAALSIYRMSAYILLVLGFFYLHRHEMLHIPSYLISLTLPIVGIVWVLVSDKENQTQDRVE